jgi:hypothetical protein
MQTTIAVVADLETLDLVPSAVILSIGLAAIDLRIGRLVKTQGILVDLHQPGRTTDASTVEWWGRQSREARETALLDGPRVRLDQALDRVGSFYHGLLETEEGFVTVWGNGAHFDISILEHAYLQLGMVVPWHYKVVRDLRTARDLSGLDPLVYEDLTPHRAVDDAIAEARDLHRYASRITHYVPSV